MSPRRYDPAPDVETIDVPEAAVALADDLDIPELAYEQDEQPICSTMTSMPTLPGHSPSQQSPRACQPG